MGESGCLFFSDKITLVSLVTFVKNEDTVIIIFIVILCFQIEGEPLFRHDSTKGFADEQRHTGRIEILGSRYKRTQSPIRRQLIIECRQP